MELVIKDFKEMVFRTGIGTVRMIKIDENIR